MTQAGEKLIRAARDARVEAARQAERRRAAGICVAEARACNRDLVETQKAADGIYPIRWFYGGTLSALLTQAGFLRERRDALLAAARKIMGKTR
jgi:IS5 family transposase